MPYTVKIVEYGGPDPGTPKFGEMFVFMRDGQPEMVEFLCPCKCGQSCPTHVVSMTEKASDKAKKTHRWGFDLATVTLFPSIRWISGCFAHFNITNGRTVWHGDSGVKRKDVQSP